MSVPVDLLRDYNNTKQDLKVTRDSVFILAADVKIWKDSTGYYKQAYLKEKKRKKCWRAAALVLGAAKAIDIWLRRRGFNLVF